MLPSELLAQRVIPTSPVALDTETSGLYVDDGARVAVVSVAWVSEKPSTVSPKPREAVVGSLGLEVISEARKETIISFAWAFDQGVSGTGKPEDPGSLDFDQAKNLDKSEWDALKEWLALVGPEVGFVFHHAKFDLHLMAAGVRRWPGEGIDLSKWTVWDTQNVCHLIWPESKTTSLKPTSQRLWGIEETNESEMVRDYLRQTKLPTGRWDLVPWELIGPYADQDARLTLRLYFRQIEDIEEGLVDWLENPYDQIHRRLMTSLMLYRIERRGLPFDAVTALKMGKEIDTRTAILEKQLPFSPPTLPAAKHYWFGTGTKAGIEGLGLPPYSVTANGGPQLNAQIIDKMVADGVPFAKTWRDLQKLNTTGSRWYEGWASMIGPDGRLRASIRQNGTVSSRFSVERVQLQAIPHDYRLSSHSALDGIMTPRQLIAKGVPDGWQLWELDLAQAELRVAALFAKCERMLTLIRAGEDLHGDAATQLFGVTPDSPDWGKMRNVAKRANFSLIFGVGADKLQADIEAQTGLALGISEVKRLVRDWNNLYPEFQKAIRFHMAKVEERMNEHPKGLGWITTYNEERRWFQPAEETHKAFNQRVQPSLAQFGLDWWLKVEADLMKELGDDPIEGVGRVGMVLMIHDSMVLLLPKGPEGEAMAQKARQTGIELWGDTFPGVPGDIDAKKWGSD